MKWHLLVPLLVCLHSTCLADDTAFCSRPITEETVANLCDAFPNNFMTVRNSLDTLEPIREPQEVARGIEEVANPSAEQFALYFLARAVLGLTRAEATLSDAALRQDQARIRICATDRAEVLKLVGRADVVFKKMGLDRRAIERIAALRFF